MSALVRPGTLVRPLRALVAPALLALLVSVGPVDATAADTGAVARQLVERVAPAIVDVRVVVSGKISYQGQDAQMPERETTAQGVVVDPSGLVMTRSESGLLAALQRKMPGLSVSIAVRGVRVQFANEAKERPAVIVARDPTNGLAFLQLIDATGAPFPFVDLASGRTAPVGTEVFGVRRLDRAFDYAPEVLRGFVCGQFEQPRKMGMLSGDFNSYGLPVFDETARVAGVFVRQVGSEGVDDDALSRNSVTGALLSLDAVSASVAQAKKKIPEALEKSKSSDSDAEKGADVKKGSEGAKGGDEKDPKDGKDGEKGKDDAGETPGPPKEPPAGPPSSR